MAKLSPSSCSDEAARCSTRLRRGDQHAELVAAHAVGTPVGLDRGAQLAGEAGEQRVAGRVAEAVVVALEAVQVEDHEQMLAVGAASSR